MDGHAFSKTSLENRCATEARSYLPRKMPRFSPTLLQRCAPVISRRSFLEAMAGAVIAPIVVTKRELASASGGPLLPANLDERIRCAMASHAVPGASLALINEGRMVWLGCYGLADVEDAVPVTDATVFEAASLSKPVFAQFAMTYVQDGKLSLDEPLAAILPLDGLSDPRAAAITARMAMAHTSGLPNWRSENPGGMLDLAFDPGRGFRYSGEGYEYLARALQHLDRSDARGLERKFQETVASPAGLGSFHFVLPQQFAERRAKPHAGGKRIAFEVNPEGEFGAAYALHTTAEDYARWLMSVMASAGPLNPHAHAQWLAPQHVPIPSDYPERALGLSDWALGFQIYEMPYGRIYMHGGNNQGFTCLAGARFDTGWGFALFTNADQATGFMAEVVRFLLGFRACSSHPARNAVHSHAGKNSRRRAPSDALFGQCRPLTTAEKGA